MKKVLLASFGLVVMVALLAWAGGEKQAQVSPEQMMAQMKADFAKCEMCKQMLPYMDQAWWMNMKHEVHNLKNGVMVIHSYPAATEQELADIHKMCSAMSQACMGMDKMSEKEMTGKLCQHCQEMSGLLKMGAKQEMVLTNTGSIGLITADKPETVKKIYVVADKWRQMFAGSPEKM